MVSNIFGIKFPGTEPPKREPEIPSTDRGEKVTLLSWQAESHAQSVLFPERFRKPLLIIGIVIGLVLIIMQEYFLLLVVASLLFVSNVLSKASANIFKFEINTHGIFYVDTLYYWEEIKQFFFIEKGNKKTLAVDTYAPFPGRMFVDMTSQDKNQVKEILEKHIFFLEEEPKTVFDKLYEQVIDKFDLDH